MPDSGRIELQYLNASTQTDTVADYRLTMTMRWDDKAALDCFQEGYVDWAYEHDVLYAEKFGYNVWNEDLSSFPQEAHAYLDTAALDEGATSLSFGIFRPEKLSAGTTYRASYDIILPTYAENGILPLTLEGEVIEKQCNRPGPWCVGLRPDGRGRTRHTFVGESRGFKRSGDCWDWRDGSSPTRCPAPSPRTPFPGQEPILPPSAPGGSSPSNAPGSSKPRISNFEATVYSDPGHVGVAYDVGWQAGRDPVTCHFFIDGVERFTAQCGTRSSKQFYGLSAGRHTFYATVSDSQGVYSDPSPTLTRSVL